MNETKHDEENSSEAEDDTSEQENVTDIETYQKENNEQETKLLTSIFKVKAEN